MTKKYGKAKRILILSGVILLIGMSLVVSQPGWAANPPVSGTVELDPSSSLRSEAVVPHSVASGPYRLLAVAVMIRADESVDSVTYGGESLSLAKAQNASGLTAEQRVEIWYLVNPPVGTTNVNVHLTDSANPSGIAVVNFTGVNQISPTGADDGADDATSTNNATTSIITLYDDSLIFGAVSARGADTKDFTPGTNINELWDDETGSSGDTANDDGIWGGELEAPAKTTSYTFNATFSPGDNWAIACVELKAAPAPTFSSITANKSAYKDGDTVTLTVTLADNNTACTLTADFSNIDDQYVAGDESAVNWGTDGVDNNDDGHTDEPAEQGIYIITYPISTGNGKADSSSYSVPVTATDGVGNSTIDNSTSLTLDNSAPPSPTGLTATALTGGGIQLTWTASSPETDVANYNIYRATSSGGQSYTSYTYQVSTGTTTYTDTSTTDGTTYYYVVRAEDIAGNTDSNTSEDWATAGITAGPSFSSIIADSSGYKDGDTIELTVTLANHNTGCTLTADFSNIDSQYVSGGESVVNWGTDGKDNDGDGYADGPSEQGIYVISYLISTVNTKSDSSYSVPVTATDAAANSASSSISLTLDNTAPPAPSGLTASAIVGGSIELSWTRSSPETDVSQYNIYRATSSGSENYSSPTYTVSAGTSSYTDASTSDGQTYYYVVRAQDAVGNTETNTNESSATADATAPPAPTNLAATTVVGSGIQLSWTLSSPETDVSQYNIYRATSSGGQNYSSPTYTVSVGTSSYTDTSVSDGVTYYYVLRAQDAAANIETNTNEVWATANLAGPSVSVSYVYLQYEQEVLYNITSSTSSENPSAFTKGKVDEVYLRLDLVGGFELNSSSSNISLFKGVGDDAEQVSGSEEINEETGWAEFIFNVDPLFDPDVNGHSRDALYWVDVSVASAADGVTDFDFYFVYDTIASQIPDFGINSFDPSSGTVGVSGTTYPDASDPQEVEIFLNGGSQGVVTADESGYFSKDGLILATGYNSIAVQSTDQAGNETPLSNFLRQEYNSQRLLSIVIRSSHVVKSGSATIPVQIIYSVTQPSQVTIHIYNLHGEIVKEWSEWVNPGEEPEWSWLGDNMYGETVNNGIYIVRVVADGGAGKRENVTKLLGVLR